MKYLKFLMIVSWLGLLATSCQKDEVEDNLTSLEESETIQEAIDAKAAAGTVDVSGRYIAAQFFENDDFSGRSYTVGEDLYGRTKFTLPFQAKSWAIAANFALRFAHNDKNRNHSRNYNAYYSSKHGAGVINKPLGYVLVRNKTSTWAASDYAGQLQSTNGKSSIPIWGNTDLRSKVLAPHFNNKVKQFSPASRSFRWDHVIFRRHGLSSFPIALHPIKHHRGGRNFAGHHEHIRKNISYLQVSARQQFSHAGWDEYGLLVGNRANKLLKQANQNINNAISIIGCWVAKGIQAQGDPSGTALANQAWRCALGDSPVTHKPTSGAQLKNDDPYDTYLIGGYNKDLKFIIDQLKYPKIKKKDIINGENYPPPGQDYNILNDDDVEYNQIFNTYGAGAFFRMVNAKWIDQAVRKKRCIKAVTHPSKCLRNKNGLTGFGKEVHRLEHKHGYRWDEEKKKFVPGNQAPNQKTWTNRGEAKVHI